MKRSFLIVEPDRVVSLDLAETLESVFGANSVVLSHSLPEAIEKIAAAANFVCVFFNSHVATDLALQVLRESVTRGAQVIFVGETRAVGFPYQTVQTPFTTEMVLSVLTATASDLGQKLKPCRSTC